MTTSRLLILGASGDLTGRYLLRALAELVDHGRLPGGVEIIGVAREPWDTEQFRNHAKQRLDDHASDLSRSSRDSLLRRLSYIRSDVTQADSLRAAVGEGEAPVVAYLALPPTLFPSAISGLASAGMPDGSRVVVEKPFGTDLASAQQLNALLHRHFLESAIFRMDHFSENKRFKTSWGSALPTGCSSPCGAVNTSKRSTLSGTKRLRWRGEPATTTAREPCGTW
jgi:glucose-6-phosphate 1-dehydrogenase